MSSEKLPDPDDWPWDFEERRGNAGVWIMEGWDGYDQDALESVFQHYDLRKTSLISLGQSLSLAKTRSSQQKHKNTWQWGKRTGVERAAFASEGLKTMAVSANVEVENDAEVEWFDDINEAVEWAAGN